MDDKAKVDLKYTLATIMIREPKTQEILMQAVPRSGGENIFDLKIATSITREQLILVVKELAQFHYRSIMVVQKSLLVAGVSPREVADLFFPGIPPSEHDDGKVSVEDPTEPKLKSVPQD